MIFFTYVHFLAADPSLFGYCFAPNDQISQATLGCGAHSLENFIWALDSNIGVHKTSRHQT